MCGRIAGLWARVQAGRPAPQTCGGAARPLVECRSFGATLRSGPSTRACSESPRPCWACHPPRSAQRDSHQRAVGPIDWPDLRPDGPPAPTRKSAVRVLCPSGAGASRRESSTGSASLHPWLQSAAPPGPKGTAVEAEGFPRVSLVLIRSALRSTRGYKRSVPSGRRLRRQGSRAAWSLNEYVRRSTRAARREPRPPDLRRVSLVRGHAAFGPVHPRMF
jgi:hypothetical protein